MKLARSVVAELAVAPGELARLDHRRTDRTAVEWLDVPTGGTPKQAATTALTSFGERLRELQELLAAESRQALLLVFQGLDAAGKDGTISHVLAGVNPQGVRVSSFKQPSAEELSHDFLWRSVRELPQRGRIEVFNRSYYEDVLVVRVHPDLLESAGSRAGSKLWDSRFEAINAFERHLSHSGTTVAKFFLHVSKAEQRRRLLERLNDPSKHWKFSAADLAEREYFDAYRHAYGEALSATSSEHAPWYVIPADDKPLMRALVAGVIVHTLEGMHPAIPEPDPAHRAALEAARARLLAEPDA
jgi:PPK2 family polyphosphate:nucleotide phosphotransferase